MKHDAVTKTGVKFSYRIFHKSPEEPDSEYRDWDDIPEDEKQQLIIRANLRFFKRMGYNDVEVRPVTEETEKLPLIDFSCKKCP